MNTTTPVSGADEPLVRERALTVFLLMATGVGFLPWFAISALGPFMVEDLGTTAALPGQLVGVLFIVAAGVSTIIGRVMAIAGPARVAAGAILVCGTALAGMATLPGLAGLAGAVALAGIALAIPMPATAVLVAQRVRARRQGTVIGIAQSGQQLGALASGIALPALAVAAGWRWALAGAAITAIVIGALSLPTVRHDRPIARGPAMRFTAPRWLMAYAFLMSSWTVSSVAYLPITGVQHHGLDGQTAGLLVTVIGAVAIGGKILWGRVAGGVTNVLHPPIILAVLSACGVSLAAWSLQAGVGWLWASAVLLGASALAWPVVTLALVARTFEATVAGAVSGRVLAAGFTGSATGPVVFAWLLSIGGLALSWWSGVVVMVTAGVIVTVVYGSQRHARERERGVAAAEDGPGGLDDGYR